MTRHAPVAVLLLLFTTTLSAQITGVLSGKVTDPSGASVPRASISITGPGDVARAAQTDNSGAFSFPGLAAGAYKIRTSAPGFNPFDTSLTIPTGRVTTLDV